MTRVLLTGFPNGKKIQAIKGVRAATGWELKQAKAVVDGIPLEIEVSPQRVRDLNGYVEYTVQGASMYDLITALERFPRTISVGDLYDVLVAAMNGRPS